MGWRSRWWLNQSTHSRVAYSTSSSCFQGDLLGVGEWCVERTEQCEPRHLGAVAIDVTLGRTDYRVQVTGSKRLLDQRVCPAHSGVQEAHGWRFVVGSHDPGSEVSHILVLLINFKILDRVDEDWAARRRTLGSRR